MKANNPTQKAAEKLAANMTIEKAHNTPGSPNETGMAPKGLWTNAAEKR